jgi:hypothetical protein
VLHGARNHEVVGVVLAETSSSAPHVVRQDRDLEPRRVRRELSRREVCEAGAGVEVLDRQLDSGVLAMEPVDLDEVTGQIGKERVVTPTGPQFYNAVSVRRVRRTTRAPGPRLVV